MWRAAVLGLACEFLRCRNVAVVGALARSRSAVLTARTVRPRGCAHGRPVGTAHSRPRTVRAIAVRDGCSGDDLGRTALRGCGWAAGAADYPRGLSDGLALHFAGSRALFDPTVAAITGRILSAIEPAVEYAAGHVIPRGIRTVALRAFGASPRVEIDAPYRAVGAAIEPERAKPGETTSHADLMSQDDAAPQVALRDDLEQGVGVLGGHRQVAHLINDQDRRAAEPGFPTPRVTTSCGTRELRG